VSSATFAILSAPPTALAASTLMQLQIIQDDDCLTHIELIGNLDLEGVTAIQDQFVFNTTTRRAPALVDLSAVDFVASLGISMLIAAAKALERNGLTFVLCAPTDLVRGTLQQVGIDKVIPIAANIEEARILLAGK
jgi:anti-anti-sigma factor